MPLRVVILWRGGGDEFGTQGDGRLSPARGEPRVSHCCTDSNKQTNKQKLEKDLRKGWRVGSIFLYEQLRIVGLIRLKKNDSVCRAVLAD